MNHELHKTYAEHTSLQGFLSNKKWGGSDRSFPENQEFTLLLPSKGRGATSASGTKTIAGSL